MILKYTDASNSHTEISEASKIFTSNHSKVSVTAATAYKRGNIIQIRSLSLKISSSFDTGGMIFLNFVFKVPYFDNSGYLATYSNKYWYEDGSVCNSISNCAYLFDNRGLYYRGVTTVTARSTTLNLEGNNYITYVTSHDI